MIDLTELRAAAARAREAGGAVRAVSELTDLVDQLCDELQPSTASGEGQDPPRVEWATRQRWPQDGSEEITQPVDETMARNRMRLLPLMHVALLRRTVTYGPWVQVPVETETNDA